MAYLLIEHRVVDFDRWKPVYDGHENVRRKAGLKELFLLRGIDDPNNVTLLFEVSDHAKAQAFIDSEDLKNKMKEAGVVGKPSVHLLERAGLRKAA